MIGAASVGAYYHGFEPAQKTYFGLLKLGDFLKSFENGFDYKIENIPFEDSDIARMYDIALTSPPYYDTEIYSQEQTNSCNRYSTFDDWISKFYYPMIEKTIGVSTCFVINVGSRGYDLKSKLLQLYPETKEIKSKLSGGGGLGREATGKESFYLVKK